MAVQLGPLAESVHVLPGPRIQPLDAQATPTTGITVPVTRDGMRDRPTRFMVSIALGRVIQVFGPPTGPERLPMLPGVCMWSGAIEFHPDPVAGEFECHAACELTLPALRAA